MVLIFVGFGLVVLAVVAFIVVMARSIRSDKALDAAKARFDAAAAEERRRQAVIEAAMPQIERGAATVRRIQSGGQVARAPSLQDKVAVYTATSDVSNEDGVWIP